MTSQHQEPHAANAEHGADQQVLKLEDGSMNHPAGDPNEIGGEASGRWKDTVHEQSGDQADKETLQAGNEHPVENSPSLLPATASGISEHMGQSLEELWRDGMLSVHPDVTAYRDQIVRLAARLPNLRNVATTRVRHHEIPRIIFYDRIGSVLSTVSRPYEPWKTHKIPPSYQRFWTELRKTPTDCVQRIVLVEDLTPAFIDLLGATFKIPPQFFEDHLDRSGYDMMEGRIQKATAWQTRFTAKGHASLTWFRPVLPLLDMTGQFRTNLIENLPHVTRCIFDGCDRDILLNTRTNIWRHNLELSPEPGAQLDFPMGWEERATIWTRKYDDCQFVIVLLDPVPTAVEKGGHRLEHFRTRHVRHRLPQTHRNTAPLPTTTSLRDANLIPTEESLSGVSSVSANQFNMPSATSRPRVTEFMAIEETGGDVMVSPYGDDGRLYPYEPITSRSLSSTSRGDTRRIGHVGIYIESLKIPTSTLEEFAFFLQGMTKGEGISRDPIWVILQTVREDCLALVDIIHVSLRRIRTGTLDEDLMQKRVTFWRELLHQFNSRLSELDERLQEFKLFASNIDLRETSTKLSSDELVRDIQQMLRGCVDAISKTSDSLRLEMQIVDSRRSIAEAESISKLTELAFVFVPLSFVASLFSMQVRELEDRVPLYRFVLVALLFVVLAYIMRLGIRSSRVLACKDKVFNQIRNGAHIQPNEPIPTHTFLAWVGERVVKSPKKLVITFAPPLFMLAVIAAILSPIAMLWIRNIERSFSAAITALLLLLDLILLYPIATNPTGEFDFDPRTIIREIRESRKLSQRERRKKREQRIRRGMDLEATGTEERERRDDDRSSSGGNLSVANYRDIDTSASGEGRSSDPEVK
ncbi:hypothetical protein K458DRAFT_431647 [Lentithecium fluviatile CBS 122367]|uniref:Cora-domain-containing protein n=1 Tax=Lentithecium fluviatile CBS 122367 TaxID=1168545 RepID=A0A6G1J0K7_9PLEO|nr:hypothetical protein K458DRAFT_431647 [Lentithecium fluviatile CBS 122367]